MTAAEQIESAGLRAFMAIHGKLVSFRGKTVLAAVNTIVKDDPAPPGLTNFNVRTKSTIQLRWTDLPDGTAPRSSEYFTEPNGTKHRVMKTRRLGLRAHVDCEVID